MKIFEYMKCDRCKALYKGEFRISINGEIYCKDCNKKNELLEDLVLEYTNGKELVNKQLLDMMIYDISELYNYYSTREESALDKFLDEDNNLDMKKVFFMGNNLDIVDKAQEVAYISIKYSNIKKDGEYIEDANYFIEKYIALREYKFTDKEMNEYTDKLYNDCLISSIRDGIYY